MAPVASTVQLSHIEGISDAARARELYKYYQPNFAINTEECFPLQSPQIPTESDDPIPEQQNVQSEITSSKISSPDTALTSFCQLVSWRLEAQRAMISLIDAGTQYFIAESTKSLDLEDSTKHQPGDELWLGSFIVTDLSKDERFNQLPFVTHAPFLRLYAGVPIITKRGIPIGSLFIVDSRRRSGLSKDEIMFMGKMAKTIMKHLEMVREVEEHRRGMKMSRGLASFVEGRGELVEADMEVEEGDGQGTKIAGQFKPEASIPNNKSKASSVKDSTQPSGYAQAIIERKEKEYSSALLKTEEAIISSHESSTASSTRRPDLENVPQQTSFETMSTTAIPSPDTDTTNKIETPNEDDDNVNEASALKSLFSRAANLIREAFEVDGGAVFFDAQKGFNTETIQSPITNTSAPHDLSDSQVSGDEYHDKVGPDPVVTEKFGIAGERTFTRSSTILPKETEILGFSTAEASSIHGDPYPGSHSFVPLEEVAVHNFLRRYPRGKLWTFDSDGSMSSASDDEPRRYHRGSQRRSRDYAIRRNKIARAKVDAKYLSEHFPGVRQLLFVPLWDASRSRWLSVCCVWSTEPTRVLSKQNELSFLSAFGNSVMAECSRINTEIADQKKSDFIGSISHELRSPLHGILASAELLDDLGLPNLAHELVETIDSCGRTLLDTINHILDFSKISSLEKNWRRNRRSAIRSSPRAGVGPLALQQADLPMINLFAPVDISVLCEEVVESVFAGCVFQNVTAKTFDMVSDVRDKSSETKRNSATSLATQSQNGLHPEVSVILDIDKENYQFTTQPGAFRRIIMNLLGNALKYTSHGYVKVKLETSELDDLHTPGAADSTPRSMITLTVTDTGKGISSEFLRSKLFTPFAQENTLSSGTGLGLSIVRSIINLLEGDITIDSEIGRGTQVKVTLPLLREMPKDSALPTTPKSATTILREADDSVALLRARANGKRVGLFGFGHPSADPIVNQMGKLLETSVRNFLTKWYGLEIVSLSEYPEIIVANETNQAAIADLCKDVSFWPTKPSILVLCSHSSRLRNSISELAVNGNMAAVAKPIAPLKLARALRQCLDTVPVANNLGRVSERSVAGPSDTNDLSNVFEDLLISPRGGEVLDNSRMATDSDNARKAIESATPNALVEKAKEFPFPSEPNSSPLRANDFPDVANGHPSDFAFTQQPAENAMAKSRTNPIQSSATSTTTQFPKLLLVDDNMINLKLLRHFITRLGYKTVDEADNGLEAVKKVEERPEGYDVIFMDISMPVLDGFGATREIRRIESTRHENAIKAGNIQGAKKAPALVIALTGLAGKNDQEEARECGVDLFLTKPVALKEVKKMLENWQSNQG
ncbi:hypothetical protein CJF30_00005304 [Rutstroemia sp. NJR-2017a BBW]|nr:hypothetical protein CJF30_00005304 [Rutstroemia sp. NJR-2017a BBW]